MDFLLIFRFSIEFDRDYEHFAVAGVSKKIKVKFDRWKILVSTSFLKLYEYESVLNNTVDSHYPTKEVLCTAKLSCISWNPYLRNYLASSDYDGFVTIWDMATAQKVRTFQVNRVVFCCFFNWFWHRNMKNARGVLIFARRTRNFWRQVPMIVELRFGRRTTTIQWQQSTPNRMSAVSNSNPIRNTTLSSAQPITIYTISIYEILENRVIC